MQKLLFRNLCNESKPFYVLLFFCFMGFASFAQHQVRGVVTDANGLVLPGVNILEKNTTNGVVTDFDGNYVLQTKGADPVIVFSYVGFLTQETVVNNRQIINITMEDNLESLDEVVVIGYGSQLKEDLSGAVSTVDTKDLEDLPQASIDQMLQGRAAGVVVTQNSGQPGSAVSVRIRGTNTLQGSSEPLYIIDGVPVSGDSNNISTSGRSIADTGIGEDGGSTSTGVSPLSALNPNDIESINILKDASASAIYGSRGANGVVIITTKRGKSGKGKFTYDTYLGLQQPTNIIDVLDLKGYAILQNEIGDIYGLDPQVEFLNPDLLGEGTNWQKEIFNDAWMQSHQLSFSGGKEGVSYFVSAGYLDQDGTVIGSGFDRLSVRSNIDAKVNDWLKIGASLTASRTKENLTLNNATNGIIGLSLLNNPATAVYNPDGSFAGPTTEEEIAFGIRNPIAEALSMKNTLTRNRIMGNIYAEFQITKHISYRTEFGGDFGNNLSDRFQPTYTYGAIERGVNFLSVRRENTDFWIIKNMLEYQNTFGENHNLTVLLGQEAQESTWQGVISEDGDFVNNEDPVLGTGNANDFNNQYKGSTALESFFSRATYSFKDRYLLNASIRADGSSKFAEGNKWGYFPSISAAWKISSEPFMNDFNAVQGIKLYGGYGEVGNQSISNFAYGSRLNTVNTDLGTGFEFANFANPDLTWESSNQFNLGLDFSLFNSRLSTTVDVYNKITKDFLYQLAVTDFVTGGNSPGAITAPWVNLGEMTNKGVEVTMRYATQGEGHFNWNSTLTFSHNINEVTELLDNLRIPGNISLDTSNQNITITQAGQPVGLFYGYKVEGLFRTLEDIEGAPVQFERPFEDALFSTTWLGDIKYKDVNGDGVINGDDRTVIGNPHPDFTFGFQNSFTYKNFDLSVFLQGSYGNDVFNAIGRSLTAGSRSYTNQSPSVLDYWSVDNPNAGSPRLARNDTPNILISDRYVEDGSYLRIQNITLGYFLPTQALNSIGISRLKLYGSIQNLYTFTNYSGYDPEVGSFNQNALLNGVDNGRYPTPRIFTLGFNVEF